MTVSSFIDSLFIGEIGVVRASLLGALVHYRWWLHRLKPMQQVSVTAAGISWNSWWTDPFENLLCKGENSILSLLIFTLSPLHIYSYFTPLSKVHLYWFCYYTLPLNNNLVPRLRLGDWHQIYSPSLHVHSSVGAPFHWIKTWSTIGLARSMFHCYEIEHWVSIHKYWDVSLYDHWCACNVSFELRYMKDEMDSWGFADNLSLYATFSIFCLTWKGP